jgi:hypothetical protein
MADRASSVMYSARDVLNGAAEALENRTPEFESGCVMPAHSFLSECQHFREQGWEKDERAVDEKRRSIKDTGYWKLEMNFKLQKLGEHLHGVEIPLDKLQRATNRLGSVFLELGLTQLDVDELRWNIPQEDYWEAEVMVWEGLMADKQELNRKLRKARQAESQVELAKKTPSTEPPAPVQNSGLAGPAVSKKRSSARRAARTRPYDLRSRTRTSKNRAEN